MKTFDKLDRENIEDIIALTPMQEGMLFHYLKDPSSEYYFEQLCLNLSGPIDKDAVEKAWNDVIENNEMLRAVYRWEKLEHPVQIILKQHRIKLRYYDLPAGGSEEMLRKDRLEKFALQKDVPFRVTLCKTAEDRCLMIVGSHHILYDGWSTGIILKEFFSAYNDRIHNRRPREIVKSKFKDFVKWGRQQDPAAGEKFWKDYLTGFDTRTGLSIKQRGKSTPGTGNFRTLFAGDIKKELDDFTGTRKLTLAPLFYCAWGILLQRYNDTGDVVFGTTVSGRSAKLKGIEDMAGLFINTLPLRILARPGEKAVELLGGIDEALSMRERYESTSLTDIKAYSEIDKNEELFDTVIVIENYPLDSRLKSANNILSVDSYTTAAATHYDLTVGITLFDEIQVDFLYKKELFTEEAVKRLAGHFKGIVADVIKNPAKEIHRIEFIPGEEKRQLLYDFNDTGAAYPEEKTIHRLFAEQAGKTPDNIAVAGPHDCVLTYGQLNEKAHGLARLLRSKGAAPGSIVAIMVDSALEIAVGLLGILKSGGAYLPIDPGYPEERITYMLADSGAGILVKETTGVSAALKKFPPKAAAAGERGGLAYVIYTSGTTGKPKAVPVSHHSAVNTLCCRKQLYQMDPGTASLQLFSYSFDGFVTGFFTPLISGTKVIQLTRGQVKDIAAVKEAVVIHNIAHFIIIPSLYQALMENLTEAECVSLKVVTLAGEKLSPRLLEITKRKNKNVEVVNEYGVTEAAVMSTIHRHQQEEETIKIGRPIWNTAIYILDRRQRLQPMGVPGELCIAGAGVAMGYLNRPELTAERFCLRRPGALFEKTAPGPRKNFLLFRTGDLGRWLPGGNIEFFGRIDYQVKIRGFRIELGEIENRLLDHPAVKKAVVTAREDRSGEKYLCAYTVSTSGRETDAEELRVHLSRRLPDYMIPSHFVVLEKFPLTPNGKIDRRTLPGPAVTSVQTYIAPRDEIEKRLAGVWSAVLKVKAGDIGIDDNFFHLGGHSLKATSLASRIHKTLDARIPLERIFQTPTIRDLAGYIRQTSARAPYAGIEAAEKREYYPLSRNQRAFYTLHQYDKESKFFNVPLVLPLDGEVKKEKPEAVFKQLIQRHESLRTSFHMIDEEPVQVVHEKAEFKVEYFDLTAKTREGTRRIKDFVRPFDLTRAPLLRVGLMEVEEGKYLLIMDIHHIVTDGTSENILIRDFTALRKGKTLPPAAIQYKDFARRQNRLVETGKMRAHEDYWVEQLSGHLPVLDMPTDFPRPARKSFAGDSFGFEIGEDLSGGIRRLARDTGTTLYMVLLAAYTILLHKMTGQEDIIIGSPVSGRTHALLENTVGLVMDSVMMRSYPSGKKTVSGLLREVRQTTLEAFEHQAYPYEELLKKVSYKKLPGRNPIADVALTLLNMFEKETVETFGGGRSGGDSRPAAHEAYFHRTAKVDFTISVVDTGAPGEIPCILEYCTALFKRESMERLAARFQQVLREMVDDPQRQLWEIDMISAQEKQSLTGEVRRCYPLSHAQKRIYYTEKTYPGTSCNTLAFTVRYKGALDKDRLETAIHAVILRHEALRLRILEFDAAVEPCQYIAPYEKEPLDCLELPGGGNPGQVYGLMDRKTLEPFPFLNGPLFYCAYIRFADGDSGYYIKIHHIIADGWAFLLLFAEIDDLYRRLEAGEAVEHRPAPSYIQYIRDEQAYLSSPRAEGDRQFWHRTLLPLPEPVKLSFRDGNSPDIDGGIEELAFPGELRGRMHRYCKGHKTSIFKLIFAGLAVYLSRAAGTEDIVIGSAAHGRSAPPHKQTTGMFVSTLPFRAAANGEQSFADFVEKTGRDINRVLKNHQKYPFDLLMEELRQETRRDPRYLLDVNLVGHGDVKEDRFKLHFHFPGYEPTPLSLHINANNREMRGILEVQWFYRRVLFSPEEIRGMHRALVYILSAALENPGEKITRIGLLNREEKRRLLYEFNDTASAYPADKTFPELFGRQVERTPDRIAVDGMTLTYRELNEGSHRLAEVLKERGVRSGTIVAVMMERSTAMAAVLLSILKAGGAYLPIDPEYPEERKQYMLLDSGARILLTTGDISSPGALLNLSEGHPLPLAACNPHRRPCYVIYTSGSTGRPKGVLVEHGNLTAYLHAFERQFNLTARDIVIQQASFAFDAFVEELYPILLKGGKLAIPARDDVKDIDRLSAFIIKHQATMITASPLLLGRLNQLDLRRFPIRIYISGGDVLKDHYIDKLLKSGEVYNTYGPTEAAVCATYYKCRQQDPVDVPIGKPIANYRVYILAKNQLLQPVGLPGELCISGPGVTRGYLNNPELTAERFCLRRAGGSFEKPPPAPPQKVWVDKQKLLRGVQGGGFLEKSPPARRRPRGAGSLLKIYKTGDRARWLADGNIEFLGRIDRQVKVRGFRIELGEIERRLSEYVSISEAVVLTSNDESGETYLCAYIVSSAVGQDVQELRRHLLQTLPGYMIPARFIQLDKLPVTFSGKIDLKALAGGQGKSVSTGTAYAAPDSEIEKKLEHIWQEILGRERIGIDDSFFDLGGHSLKAVTMAARIHEEFKIKLSLAELFKTPSIRALAGKLRAAEPTDFIELEKAEKREYYPLSFNQRRVYILQGLDPQGPAYNMPARMILPGGTAGKVVEKVLETLVERHESLRTGFKTVADEPVQFIAGTIELPFRVEDISAAAVDQRRAKQEELYTSLAAAPFDLESFPLFRAVLVKTAPQEYEFMFNMHHLITDGWSIEILKKEFFQLLEGYGAGKPMDLVPPVFRYRDFSRWHNKQATGPAARFWEKKLAVGIPALHLPVDLAEGSAGAAGAACRCMIGRELKEKLSKLAEHYRTSLFTIMFSVYIMLLSRVSGQQHIGCSVIAAGREHASLQNIVGLFVNSILFNVRVDKSETFDAFIRRMSGDVMESFQYQGYPMERVFEQLNIRYPDISVSFNMLNMQDATAGLRLEPFKLSHIAAARDVKFDLEPYIGEYENGIAMEWVYRRGLFEPATMEFIVNLYMKLLAFFLQDPHRALNDHEEERKRPAVRFKKRRKR